MKYTTMKEIIDLETLVAAKMDRISSLKKMVKEIRSSYRDMTDSELEDAVKAVAEIHRDMKEDKEWVAKANDTISKFFAPAQKEE